MHDYYYKFTSFMEVFFGPDLSASVSTASPQTSLFPGPRSPPGDSADGAGKTFCVDCARDCLDLPCYRVHTQWESSDLGPGYLLRCGVEYC